MPAQLSFNAEASNSNSKPTLCSNFKTGILFGLLGFAVNWFKLELFFNVDFLFGSVITMFALMRYGLAAGTIAALVAATCTWYHWHQPWSIIIFSAEAIFAGVLAKRRRWELLTGDIFFWFSAGLLLVWFFYNQVMGFPLQVTLLIALKQGVNGIFNTLVAMGLSIAVSSLGSRRRELPSLYQVIFVSLALFVLIPAMGYLYFDIQKTLNQQMASYRKTTARICDISKHSVSLWLTLNRDTVMTLAGLIGSAERITQPEMQRIVEITRSNNPEFRRIGILNKSAITQAFSPLRDDNGASTIGVDLSDRGFNAILQSPAHPFVFDVNMGKIGIPRPRLLLVAPILAGDKYQGAAFGVVDFSVLQRILDDIVATSAMTVTLVDQNGRVVVSTQKSIKTLDTFSLPPNGSISSLADGVGHWIPAEHPGKGPAKRWFESFYVKEMPLTLGNGWKVVVESSIRPQLEEIGRQTAWSLGVVAFLIMIFIILSRLFAARYSLVMQKLEGATRQLPIRISSGEEVAWPTAMTFEMAGLVANFQVMAKAIQGHVSELESLNVSLEQRVAERTQELSESRTLLNSIINGTSDAVYVKDLKGRYLLFNVAAENFVGKSAADVLGKDDYYLFHPVEAMTVMDGDRKVIEGGVVRSYEEIVTDSAGQEVTFLSTKGPLFDETGNPIGLFGVARDITDRKRAEEELQEALHGLKVSQIELEMQNGELRRTQLELENSRARYIELYDQAPVGYLTLNEQGLILEANLTAATLLGIERSTLVNQPFNRHILPEDQDICYLHRRQLLKVGTPQACEMRMLKKDNNHFWVKLMSIATHDKENGKPVFRVVVSDINENKRAEEALRDSEKRLSMALAASKMGVWEWDLQSNAVCWSPECHVIVGLKVFDGTFESFAELLHPEDAARVMDTVERAVAQGCTYADVFRIIRPDGELCWLSNLGQATYDKNGVPLRLIGTVQDITDRKRIEQELLEASQFNEQIISSAQEGVIVYDLGLRYRVWNTFMEEMSGMTASEVLGRHPSELFPFVQKSGLIERLEKVLTGDMPGPIEFPYSVPEAGKSGWGSEKTSPLRNTKGEIIGAISIVSEITWRKQLVDELKQALKTAETANVTMSRLLHTVAHEFRTPLGLLTGSADIMDRYWDRLSPEKRFEQNEHIRSAARQISNLINSVISFNQLGNDRSGLPPLLLDIEGLCRTIADEVATVWSAGHECHVAIAADCGAALLDEILFRRVLENLLANAFRYTPPGGSVSLHVKRDNNRLLIDVIDTGIGIPEEDQAFIFDAFYRSRNVEGRRGLGLGLSIVQEALLQMGGSIAVSSSIGEGTDIRVEIPVILEPASSLKIG